MACQMDLKSTYCRIFVAVITYVYTLGPLHAPVRKPVHSVGVGSYPATSGLLYCDFILHSVPIVSLLSRNHDPLLLLFRVLLFFLDFSCMLTA